MRGSIRAAAIGLALCMLLPAAAEDPSWQARLERVPIDPATAATVTGGGEAAAELDGRELRISGRFDGLQGPATTADLREGPYTGVRGKAIGSLSVTQATAGTLSGSVQLSSEQVEALRAGRLYVQIASKSAPDGNLWGWLLP
jgi:hypothetical protein